MFSWSTPYSRDSLEKSAVNKLVYSFSFTETKRSLTCSHDPTTGLYSTFLLILLSQVLSVAGFDDCEHMNTIDIKFGTTILVFRCRGSSLKSLNSSDL
jgi:hypothetical protein